MQWTRQKSTILGTHYAKRGTWHGIPYRLNASSTKGMTRAGWAIAVLAALLLIIITVVEELVL